MIVFPLISTVLSAACAAVMARDALRRPRPDKIIWAIAFLLFAFAAGAQVAGSAWGWTELLARTYYISGAALVVAFLGIGQLYLLWPDALKRFGVGLTLLITALWTSLVWNAPIDASKLEDEGWKAIDRGPEIIATSVIIDSLGTLVIVGGTAWTVWKFRRQKSNRNRMIGCGLICLGTMTVAAGGSLTRLGSDQYLYIAMAVGVALIFCGVLQARRPEEAKREVASAQPVVPTGNGIAYARWLIGRDPDEIARLCAEWSVPQDAGQVLSRSDARRAWALRTSLGPSDAGRFDGLPLPVRRQVSTLYHEVLTWERPGREEIAELIAPEANAIRQA